MSTQNRQDRGGLTWTYEPARLCAETFGHPALELEMACDIGIKVNGRWIKTPVRALWDTGTSITVISPQVASRLPLVKLDRKIRLSGMNTQGESDLFLASIIFPNGKCFGPIAVAVQELPSIDVLLGMNVIMSGTFTLERKPDGGTRFTFSMNL